MPETFSWECLRTCRKGVTPRSPQVRRSRGSIRKPVSSRQTSQAFRRASFFNSGEVLLDPEADTPIIAFSGYLLGPLGRQAQRAQQTADMIWVIGDMEPIFEEPHNSLAGPQSGLKSESLRSLQDPLHQAAALCLGVNLGGRPGAGLARSPLGPLFR